MRLVMTNHVPYCGKCHIWDSFITRTNIKGMEHVPNIFMSFDKYLFLEVINILI